MNALQKIRQVHDDMPKQLGPKAQNDAWALVGRLLERLPGSKAEAARVVKERDLAGLDALIRSLEQPAAKPAGAPAPVAKAADLAPPPDDAAGHGASKEDLDAALRAFRKRLKLARLNDESRLGGRYTSGGKASKIDAIVPPTEYPAEVWRTLVRAGRLVDTGGGFLALPE